MTSPSVTQYAHRGWDGDWGPPRVVVGEVGQLYITPNFQYIRFKRFSNDLSITCVAKIIAYTITSVYSDFYFALS